MKFGQLLDQHIKANGFTQADVAEITGLTRAAICQIVNGKRDVMLTTALKIVRRTQMPLSTWMRIEIDSQLDSES